MSVKSGENPALLNRKLEGMGKPAVNHKRVYRIMRQNGLLLARYTGKQRVLSHEGKVITLCSNLRWCSDGFEIPCLNGQVMGRRADRSACSRCKFYRASLMCSP
ncbi:hypothetical protein Nmul_A1297 [Nitrosospira multiformis ATCC 25196]|uniref:HTH-like domain-containing protein n=1 Tax=Nitrosospira multiformis (strain ATCC 25196 / NCIMB 11849 / C 71) TaxID=323848 RepID=Q2Y9H1_NITMU|nr:hypothetical protein Nmul_A1297 [Nitrosospira multiformis ATCC 25196]